LCAASLLYGGHSYFPHFTPEFKDSSVECFVFGELNHCDIVTKKSQLYQLAEKLEAESSTTAARIVKKMRIPEGKIQKLNKRG
jgi:hypothetical protein